MASVICNSKCCELLGTHLMKSKLAIFKLLDERILNVILFIVYLFARDYIFCVITFFIKAFSVTSSCAHLIKIFLALKRKNKNQV